MRWALVACLFACGSRSDLSPPPTTIDSSIVDAKVEPVSDVAIDANTPVLVDGLGNPWAIVVDQERVYFSVEGAGVMSCAKAGCNDTPTMLVPIQYPPRQLALDGSNLYWPDDEDIRACALGGCGQQPSTLTSFAPGARGVARADAHFAWTGHYSNSGVVGVCVMPGCGSPVILADSQVAALWVTFDSVNVYWTNSINSSGTIMQCTLDGCGHSPLPLASAQNDPEGIAVDGAAVYWSAGGSVLKCAIGGCNGQPSYVFESSSNVAGGGRVALDAGWIYWVGGPSIVKCPVSGCTSPTVVSPPAPAPILDFALDATRVWYAVAATTPHTGAILEAPK